MFCVVAKERVEMTVIQFLTLAKDVLFDEAPIAVKKSNSFKLRDDDQSQIV